MTIELRVTLDRKQTPWELVVDNCNKQTEVGRKRHAQLIRWRLSGFVERASFVSLKAKAPGFEWSELQPPAGVFGDIRIRSSPSGYDDILTLSDHNESDMSVGGFKYKLRIRLRGRVYETGPLRIGPGTSTKSPIIVNN